VDRLWFIAKLWRLPRASLDSVVLRLVGAVWPHLAVCTGSDSIETAVAITPKRYPYTGLLAPIAHLANRRRYCDAATFADRLSDGDQIRVIEGQTMQDRVVLITGAASGIGAATARAVAAHGGIPVLVDCDAQPLASVVSTCGDRALSFVVDVSDLDAMQAMVDAVCGQLGRIDVVFANAGIAAFGPVSHVEPAAWWRCVEVNVKGVFNTVRTALPAIKATRGYILINVSMSALAHAPVMSAYAASKSAIEAMGNAWRIELAAHQVQVGLFYAGWVRTPLVEEGALHPAFVRLRATMPGLLNREVTADEAATVLVAGMVARKRRLWLPGWLRGLYAIRSLLHMPFAERALLSAAPEIEAFYLEGLASAGALASTFGPRERERSAERRRQQAS